MVLYATKEMGTKYLINCMANKFRGLLARCAENGFTLDIAECRLGPSCAYELSVYYGKVKVINSEIEELNEILEHNYEEARKVFEKFPVLDIPEHPTYQDLFKLLPTLQTGSKYALKPNLQFQSQIAFCVMLILMRPDIEWDIAECGISIYEFVRDKWSLSAEPHDYYLEFAGSSYYVREVVNGYIDTKEYTANKIPYKIYIQNHQCLPADFGSKNLVQLDSNNQPIGEWGGVVSKCLRVLTRSDKPKVKKLVNYLKFRR